MIERPAERAAAAIVRAWIEAGESGGLRVRVTEVTDLDQGTGRAHPAVASVDEAAAIVAAFLAAFVAGRSPRENGGDRDDEQHPGDATVTSP
jgi:hypothetical protein